MNNNTISLFQSKNKRNNKVISITFKWTTQIIFFLSLSFHPSCVASHDALSKHRNVSRNAQTRSCALTDETISCIPSLVDADTNNDGQITSYEYIAFANNLAGEIIFTEFPISLVVAFGKLSCMCHQLGEPKTCCTNGQPHISLDVWIDNNNIPSDVEICYFNDVCSITKEAVESARTRKRHITPSPTPKPITYPHPSSTPESSRPTTRPDSYTPTNDKMFTSSKIPSNINPASNNPAEIPTISPSYFPTKTPNIIEMNSTSSSMPVSSFENKGLFTGEYPIAFEYTIGNFAGLTGDEIFFETNGNNVKKELIEATNKLANEVNEEFFKDSEIDLENKFHLRRMSGGSLSGRAIRRKRQLKVTYDPNSIPKINQIISSVCPDVMVEGLSCANIISTVFVQIEDEHSPSDIGNMFQATMVQKVEEGRFQELLPQDSVVSSVVGKMSLIPSSPTTLKLPTETTPKSDDVSAREDDRDFVDSLVQNEKKEGQSKDESIMVSVGVFFGISGLLLIFTYMMKRRRENNTLQRNEEHFKVAPKLDDKEDHQGQTEIKQNKTSNQFEDIDLRGIVFLDEDSFRSQNDLWEP